MTKLAPEWVRTSDPVIRSPARYRWTTAPALCMGRSYIAVSELSSRLRLRALAICQLIFRILVRMSVARVRLPRWALVNHCWFSAWPTASLPSVVVCTRCLLFQRNIPWPRGNSEVGWFRTHLLTMFHLLNLE